MTIQQSSETNRIFINSPATALRPFDPIARPLPVMTRAMLSITTDSLEMVRTKAHSLALMQPALMVVIHQKGRRELLWKVRQPLRKTN